MIKREDIENLEKLRKEKQSLEERIRKIENKPRKIMIDGVKGSSREFPYTLHNCRIEGYDDSVAYRKRKNTVKKLRRMLRYKEVQIYKEIVHIEYELNYVDDPEIRELIRLKYEDGLSWVQIQIKKEYNSESTARIKLDRFFRKK